MKLVLGKIFALLAIAAGLSATALSQMGAPPPPPPSESVETLTADYTTIVTGTLSDFLAAGSIYGARPATVEVHQILKGEKASNLQISIRENTGVLAGWKLHHNLLLIAISAKPGEEALVVDLADPKMAVLTEKLKVLRNPDMVVHTIQESLPKQIPPQRFDLEIPRAMADGTILEKHTGRTYGPSVNLPIDASLEADAKRVLSSKDIHARCSAIEALSYFKSEANIRRLQSLLRDKQFAVNGDPKFTSGIEQHDFLVRSTAAKVLAAWGIHVDPIVRSEDADVLDQLTEFAYSGVPKTKILKRLVASNKLTNLWLSAGKIDDDQMKLIGRLTHLQWLTLGSMAVTDRQVGYLRNLRSLHSLDLYADWITDASVPVLSRFTTLAQIGLAGNSMSNKGIANLKRALPKTTFYGLEPSPSPFLEQTNAVCNKTIYGLTPSDRSLLNWSTLRIGRLTGPLQWSKSPTGRDYIGPFGQQSVTLRLHDIPQHKNVEVEIDLWVIGSWDGDGTIGAGPDIIDIAISNVGTALHSTFFNNGPELVGPILQSFPGPYPGIGHPAYSGAAEIDTLGFVEPPGSNSHRDAVYKLHYTFAHTGSDLVLTITGDTVPQPEITELTNDENWGIGGIRVKTDGR